eukprot:TRINITY_DN4688_c0_g1_i2.p1 TRINITY_DN4688_c0_g1~~TRINITY_DN4688_c0_g1_i2.p1  ORF type:complete len:1214 (+),score=278.54 TRINITY_DN4688_c0_g1_i2:125-3766(+)
MGDAVRVAVRVRPFNSREKERNAKLIIQMEGQMTSIVNPMNDEKKNFSFDFSYWSHDGFSTRADGMMIPDGEKYADQRRVFDDLGQSVLENAKKGFNCSLFAYGQTGSGKSYSMVGYGKNKGIVPITCDELFQIIEGNKDPNRKFIVTVSMLEIYNEQVRDLMSKEHVKGGLQVRSLPKIGTQVVGLQEIQVNSYTEIDQKVLEGTRNRTIAATNMNATSSRAHTVVTINFSQILINGGGPGKNMEQKSRINLVDLAGSERADSTGATGDRLKEGSAINLSLTMLGNVIEALAELSTNPKKKIVIPYRDSKLTLILQDALGGNSKTIMIAALSPADINYEETLSTLRYADRAKKIKNRAVVNLDPTQLMIQKLKDENQKLLEQIKKLSSGQSPDRGISEEEMNELRAKMEEELKQKMEENMKMLEGESKRFEVNMSSVQEDYEHTKKRLEEVERQRKIAEEKQMELDRKKQTVPHIFNLNEDPALSKLVYYFLESGRTLVGKVAGENTADISFIQLSGLSVKDKHALIMKQPDETFTLTCIKDAKVFKNGHQMSANESATLTHNDRILFGNNHMYIFHHPKTADPSKDQDWSWDDAQGELAKDKGIEVPVTGVEGNSNEQRKRQQVLQEDLIHLLPLINEANDISVEMEKGLLFSSVIMPTYSGNMLVPEMRVKITTQDEKGIWIWSTEKFKSRVYLMREFYQNFMDSDDQPINIDSDPFWDPIEKVHLGSASVLLESLANMLDFETITDIKGASNAIMGSLQIAVVPCTPEGKPIDDDLLDDYDVDEPEELIGRRLDFLVRLPHARGLPAKFTKNVFCQFSLFGQDNILTKTVSGSINPEFNFQQQFTIPKIDMDILQYLLKDFLFVHLYAEPTCNIVHPGKASGPIIDAGSQPNSRPSSKEPSQRRSRGEADGAATSKQMEVLKEEFAAKEKAMKDEINRLKFYYHVGETQIQNLSEIIRISGDSGMMPRVAHELNQLMLGKEFRGDVFQKQLKKELNEKRLREERERLKIHQLEMEKSDLVKHIESLKVLYEKVEQAMTASTMKSVDSPNVEPRSGVGRAPIDTELVRQIRSSMDRLTRKTKTRFVQTEITAVAADYSVPTELLASNHGVATNREQYAQKFEEMQRLRLEELNAAKAAVDGRRSAPSSPTNTRHTSPPQNPRPRTPERLHSETTDSTITEGIAKGFCRCCWFSSHLKSYRLFVLFIITYN